MDYNLLPNLEFCKEIVDGLSSFLYYTHLPPTVIGLGLGFYVLFKNPYSTSARLLSALSITFALWASVDLLIWLLYDHATPMMFLWSLIGILSTLLFAFTLLFTYSFVTDRPIRPLHIWLLVLLVLPVAIITPTAYSLQGFDVRDCVAVEGNGYLYYYHALGLLTALIIPFIPLFRRQDAEHAVPRSAITLSIIGAEFFVITFLFTSFLSSYLVDAGIVPDFGIEQYGILAMAIFMAFLGYVIVQYRAFNLRILGAQALVLALIIPIASEYLFIQSRINFWLVTLTLCLTLFFGNMLIRSVRREVRQREHIEQLAKELQTANDQQVVLIHFITHQIKGFVTKSRNIFSMMLEGEFGPVPDTMKPMIEEGFRSDTKGANTIQEILNAANIKSGKVTYAQESVELKELTSSIVQDLKPAADAKALTLTFSANEDGYAITGDKMQLTNAIKNLIDNSVKYTPTGKVDVSLAKHDGKMRLTIKDTGVGISPDDMKLLFTEGGHGKESTKINVDSTGFGLYIVKNIIEAHNGRVWAESEGTGKGSTFVVELPVV